MRLIAIALFAAALIGSASARAQNLADDVDVEIFVHDVWESKVIVGLRYIGGNEEIGGGFFLQQFTSRHLSQVTRTRAYDFAAEACGWYKRDAHGPLVYSPVDSSSFTYLYVCAIP